MDAEPAPPDTLIGSAGGAEACLSERDDDERYLAESADALADELIDWSAPRDTSEDPLVWHEHYAPEILRALREAYAAGLMEGERRGARIVAEAHAETCKARRKREEMRAVLDHWQERWADAEAVAEQCKAREQHAWSECWNVQRERDVARDERNEARRERDLYRAALERLGR